MGGVATKLSVRNLSKRYGAVPAARGVSFDVADGEVFGLLGPNGAGKTTTIECIVGLREPDDGTIEVCGLDARRQGAAVKQKIGAALQTTALQDAITPREALRLFGSFYRSADEPAALLERFALGEKADARFDSLSGGQRQRLALALAFINRPEIVFLDEPTAGLDPQARRDLHGEILRMKADGQTVVLTTHYLEEAETLCDRVAIIARGEIAATGAPRDLVRQSTDTPLVELSTVEPLAPGIFDGIAGLQDLTRDANGARFRTADAERTVAAVLERLAAQRIHIADLRVRKATLESVFLDLVTTGSDTTTAQGPS
jgi:ABC-2 type transport system ATP-binding protein